jgi:hypothetical protein
LSSISGSIEGSVRQKTAGWQAHSPFFEIASVLVRFDHVASVIVNANQRHVLGILISVPIRQDSDYYAQSQWTKGHQ